MVTKQENQVLDALLARRSIPRVHSNRPPRDSIEQIIEAAGHAPNHHHTHPWRFIVLAGTAREELGEVMAESLRVRLQQSGQTATEADLAKERAKPLRAPVVIVVAAVPDTGPKAIEIEEVVATAAAVENMLLAAQSLGLGAMWRTGRPAYDPVVKRFLELPEQAHIVSFLYVGYPDLPDLPPRASGALSHTRWRGWTEG
jgi:nitroreductase